MLWALTMLGVLGVVWLDVLLRRAGRVDLVQLNAAAVPYVLATVSAATIGAILAARRPRHPVGWLLLALGASIVVEALATGYVAYGVLARPGSLPAAPYGVPVVLASFVFWLTFIGLVMLLTPTGRLPSPRWRWPVVVALACSVAAVGSLLVEDIRMDPPHGVPNPLAIHSLAGPITVAANVTATLSNLNVLVGAAALVVRFRRARGVERLQLRWMVLAAALSCVVALVVVLAAFAGNWIVLLWAAGVLLAVLPLAVAASILRYRLYDLDRIVSRTVAYALLTVLLGGGYAALVLGLGNLVAQDSPLVVAGATLAVAAAFQPARRRVQDLVDRRFDRRRYDAARTIAAFSARLRAEVDLDSLSAELVRVVDQTMQPTSVALWLRAPGDGDGGRPGRPESRQLS